MILGNDPWCSRAFPTSVKCIRIQDSGRALCGLMVRSGL